MSKLHEQQQQIEIMRARLHELVIAKNCNMVDHEVAELSIQLDHLIVEYEKSKAQHTKG